MVPNSLGGTSLHKDPEKLGIPCGRSRNNWKHQDQELGIPDHGRGYRY